MHVICKKDTKYSKYILSYLNKSPFNFPISLIAFKISICINLHGMFAGKQLLKIFFYKIFYAYT